MSTMKPTQASLPTFEFINIETPGDAPSRARRQQVRSHAARNSRQRQKKVSKYQVEQGQHGPENNRVLAAINCPRISNNMSAARTDPFDSFIREVSRFEWYLIDHFNRHVVMASTVCIPFISPQEEAEFIDEIGKWWTRMAAIDTGILAALLQTACRNLSTYHHSATYTALTLEYTGECLDSLKHALDNEATMSSDLTIAKTFALASDATLCGNAKAAKVHLEGLKKLVAMRGGVEKISYGRAPGKMVTWFLKGPNEPNALVTTTCINLMASAHCSEQEVKSGAREQ